MDSKDELIGKIEHWVRKQGYPLEMEVAAAFQRAGLQTSLSDYYEDHVTKELREIDVSAAHLSELKGGVALQTSCFIECKSGKEKPWILFSSHIQPDLRIPSFELICSEVYKLFFFEMLENTSFRAYLSGLRLWRPEKTAHGITQAFTEGMDIPYKAAMSAVKASIHRTITIDRLNSTAEINDGPFYSCVAIPVIVIDGRLFECSTKNGEGSSCDITLSEVGSGVLHWKGIGYGSNSTLIHILTKSAISKFISELNESIEVLEEMTFKYKNELYRMSNEFYHDKQRNQL